MRKILAVTVLGLSMMFGYSAVALAANSTSDPVTTVQNGTSPVDPQPTTYPDQYGMPTNGLISGDTSTDKNDANNANKTGDGITTNDGSTRADTIKNVDGQRTHGEYQNNTNSCASCHQTHTGESGGLLFKDGVYNTCTACHDGTLGFYNVFANGVAASTAGTFGGNADGHASVHLANGAMQVKAAPGGNRTSANTEGAWAGEFNCASCHSPHGSYSNRLLAFNPNDMGKEGQEEGGKGVKVASYAGNVYDVTALTDYKDDTGKVLGQTIAGIDLSTNEKIAEAQKFVAVKGPANDVKIGVAALDAAAGTKTAIVVYKLIVGNAGHGEPSYYVRNNDPWLYGYDYWATNKPYWTRFYSDNALKAMTDNGDGTGTFHSGLFKNAKGEWVQDTSLPKTDVMTQDTKDASGDPVVINFGKGFAYGNALANAKGASIAQAYIVTLDMVPIANYGGVPIYTVNEAALNGGALDANGTLKGTTTVFDQTAAYAKDAKVTYNKLVYSAKKAIAAGALTTTPDRDSTNWGVVKGSGFGVAMSNYCAACHTDYLAQSGHETGLFSSAYRHTTTTDSYTCVRCHFAHGTDVEVMKDAAGNTMNDLTKTGGKFENDPTKAYAYLTDKNPSSALKRYTNMAVCYSCHTSSHAESFINVPDYQNNAAALKGLTDSKTATELGASDRGDIGKTGVIDPSVNQGFIR